MIRLLTGDCRDVLSTLETASVQTCITSPPYYGLRKYTDDSREIGQEATPDCRARDRRRIVGVIDGVTTLTISRKLKRLSDTEITVFKRDLAIPATATRYPSDGQGMKEREGATWHFVAFRWEETTDG